VLSRSSNDLVCSHVVDLPLKAARKRPVLNKDFAPNVQPWRGLWGGGSHLGSTTRLRCAETLADASLRGLPLHYSAASM
jgi:hypothetical protein